MIKKQMTDHEWETIYKMTKDKSLYQNLISSIFPTIHGKRQVIMISNYILSKFSENFYSLKEISIKGGFPLGEMFRLNRNFSLGLGSLLDLQQYKNH